MTEAGNKNGFGFVCLFDLQGSFRDVQRRHRVALCHQRRGKVVEGHDEIRLDLERAAVARDGFVQPTHAAQRGTQAVVSLRKVRSEHEGLAVAADRFIRLAQVPQNVAEIEQGLDVVRPEVEGLSVAGRRLIELALVQQGQPQIPMDFGIVAGIDGEDLAVAQFGFDQPSGLMVAEASANISWTPNRRRLPMTRQRDVACDSSPVVASTSGDRVV